MSWSKAALGDVCDIVSGATPKTSEARFWGGGVLWTTPKDLSDLETPYIENTPRTITDEGLKSCATSVLPENSVLLSSRAPIGLVAINKKPMATNQGFKSLVPHPRRVDSQFLYFWLKSKTEYLQSLGNGATFKELSKAVVERIEIPLPAVDEQRRIAAILDKADVLRRKRKRALELLDGLTQSIFRDMFGDYKRSTSVPKVSVREAGRVQLGRQRAPKYQTGEFTKPYIRVANVYEDMIDTSDVLSMDFNQVEFPEYRLGYGDILLNEGQSTELVGRPAMWRCEIDECCFQNTLVRFQVDRSKVVPEFALAVFLDYFRSGDFSSISSKTSSVAHLGAARFAAMPFPLLPLERQHEFVQRKNAVDRRRRQVSESVILSEALFSSLQNRAFTGQL